MCNVPCSVCEMSSVQWYLSVVPDILASSPATAGGNGLISFYWGELCSVQLLLSLLTLLGVSWALIYFTIKSLPPNDDIINMDLTLNIHCMFYVFASNFGNF